MTKALDRIPAPERAGERDLDAFLRVVRPRLRALLARQRVPPEDAEDILQQTLLALVYQWDRVRDPDAWLVGTVRNQCRLYWRRRRSALYEAVDAVVLEWLAAPLPPPQAHGDLWRDVEAMLELMPDRCRRLLRLRYQLGYEGSEVAARMGYSPLSINKITQRCLAELTRRLVARGASDGETGIVGGEPGSECAPGDGGRGASDR